MGAGDPSPELGRGRPLRGDLRPVPLGGGTPPPGEGRIAAASPERSAHLGSGGGRAGRWHDGWGPLLAQLVQPAGHCPLAGQYPVLWGGGLSGGSQRARTLFASSGHPPALGMAAGGPHRPGSPGGASLPGGPLPQRLPIRRREQRAGRPALVAGRTLHTFCLNQRRPSHLFHLHHRLLLPTVRGGRAHHAAHLCRGRSNHGVRFLLPGPGTLRRKVRPGGDRASGLVPVAYHLQPAWR